MACSKAPKYNLTNHLNILLKNIFPFLMRHKSAKYFLQYVDYVAFQLPEYPKIIRFPIGLHTIYQRLRMKFYNSSKSCINDIKLLFINCYIFNEPGNEIVRSALILESFFNDQLKKLCSFEEKIRKPFNSKIIKPPRKKYNKIGKHLKASNEKYIEKEEVLVSNIVEEDNIKQEVSTNNSTPEVVELQTEEELMKEEEMKNTAKLISELMSSKYRAINYLFLEPVNTKSLGLLDYDDKIKFPMDLSTIQKNLDEGIYETKESVANDIYLMLNNCFVYNGISTDIGLICKKFQTEFESVYLELFQEKCENDFYTDTIYFLARILKRHKEIEELIFSNNERMTDSKQKLESIAELIESKSHESHKVSSKTSRKRKMMIKFPQQMSSPKISSKSLNKKTKFTKANSQYDF